MHAPLCKQCGREAGALYGIQAVHDSEPLPFVGPQLSDLHITWVELNAIVPVCVGGEAISDLYPLNNHFFLTVSVLISIFFSLNG